MVRGIGQGDSFRRRSLVDSLRRRLFFHSRHGNRFANLLMRLKIEVAGSPLGNTGKDRTRDKPTIVQFRFAGVCIIEHNQTDKLRMLGGQIAGKRNDVLPLFVPASRIDLLFPFFRQ